MASRNSDDCKRFIFRSPGKILIAHIGSENKSRSNDTSKILHSHMIQPKRRELRSPFPSPVPQRLATFETPRLEVTSPRIEVTSPRRIFVVRTNKPQTTQRPAVASSFTQQDTVKVPPINNQGVSF